MSVADVATTPAQRRGPARLAGAFVLMAMLAGLVLAQLGVGARAVAPGTVVEAFIAFDPGNFDHHVVRSLRLPRCLAGLMAGMALGVCGALIQSVTRNPLGEPQVLGLNAGAALAVVSAITFAPALAHLLPAFSGAGARPFLAAFGAAMMFALVLAAASAGKGGPTPLKVTLCGIAFSAFAAALTSAQLILDEQTLGSIRLWLAGDLAGQSVEALTAALLPVMLGLGLALLLSGRLNMLALGDQVAKGLGVNLLHTRIAALLSAGLLCGAAVSLAGPIGFVGLVVPHAVRTIAGRDMRLLLPLCAIAGAALLLAADLAARTLFAPRELATGAMTALVGVPVFLILAARSRP